MLDEIKETLKIASEEPKRYDETRQQWIDTSSQKVDDVITGGLQKINMPGAEFIGDRARNITGFAQDMTIPESWELPLLAGGAAVAVAEPTPFGEALVGLKYGTGVGSRAYRAGKKVLKKPIAIGTAMAANIVDDAFSRANSLFNRNNSNWRLAAPDGDLRPDFTSPVNPNARIENLGGRGFKKRSELTRAGIHPSHHKGDKLYNYPEIPEGGEFLWYGKRNVDVPTPKGEPVDLGDGFIGSKNDIDLSTFDLSDPTKVSKQFEDLLRQALEVDQIGMKHLSHIGEKRSKVIEGLTGEETVGKMWNDYLAGYFNKFIRSGKADNFDQAVAVKLPNGRILKGDSGLARELRLWTINPDVVQTGFTKRGTKLGSRQYQRDLNRIVDNHNPGADPNFSSKFHAHHINVIEEEWPLVKGLNSRELVKMRVLLKKHIKYPSGNEIGNRLIVLDEIHSKIHADYWPRYAEEFRKIVNDHNFNTLYPTAKSREELVIMFGDIVEEMMNEAILPDIDKAIRKAHTKYNLNITNNNVGDYVDEILQEIEFERSKSLEKAFEENIYDEAFSKEEIEKAFGSTDDPFKK